MIEICFCHAESLIYVQREVSESTEDLKIDSHCMILINVSVKVIVLKYFKELLEIGWTYIFIKSFTYLGRTEKYYAKKVKLRAENYAKDWEINAVVSV